MASSEGIISLGPWGGSGGGRWSYRASGGITEIVLRVEGNIKSISFKDASGLVSGTFGGTGNDPNGMGEEKKIEIRRPSEHLKSISGTYGSYNGLSSVITSLSFITNFTTYGPFGTAPGETFSIPIANSAVVGFHGRCGYYLDALGIFVTRANSHASISVGPWGGPGGHPFSFTVGSCIQEIIVHEGASIQSLSFRDGDGQKYGPFGGNNSDTGKERKIEIDGLSEHLTSITGTYGDHAGFLVITSLSFITNLTTYGPFGTATGTSFSVPIEGSVVTGFHGREGGYIDAIGIFVLPQTTI